MNVEIKLYSISEVSEATGVNSVTLRAWQRRYGLLVPQRTPKGHRLYTDSDIAKIHKILTWLAKGVSIGKVKPLLEGTAEHHELNVEKIEMVDETIGLIEQGKPQQIEKRVREALKLYPFNVLEEQFLKPIEQHITRSDNPLKTLQKSVWNSALTQCFITILAKVNLDKNPPSLVLSFSSSDNHFVWQQALKLAYEGYYAIVLSDLLGKIIGLSAFITEHDVNHVYIVGENKLDNKQLADIEIIEKESNVQVSFIGSIKMIHQQ